MSWPATGPATVQMRISINFSRELAVVNVDLLTLFLCYLLNGETSAFRKHVELESCGGNRTSRPRSLKKRGSMSVEEGTSQDVLGPEHNSIPSSCRGKEDRRFVETIKKFTLKFFRRTRTK